MNPCTRNQRTICTAAALGLAWSLAGPALAQGTAAGRFTLDLQGGRSRLSADLDDGSTAEAHLVWERPGQAVLRLDLLDERKFGAHGGLLNLGLTRELGEDWIVSANLAAGHGGANWARQRIDLDIARKWLADRSLVSHLAIYHARFDNDRSDQGLRVALVAYLPEDLVAELGVIANTSQPGSVHSAMPWASLGWGREGWQYLTLRVASGREAWQAVGNTALVDFHSRSVALGWRRWLWPDVGVQLQGEHYRNPSYQRRSLGAGLFYQW